MKIPVSGPTYLALARQSADAWTFRAPLIVGHPAAYAARQILDAWTPLPGERNPVRLIPADWAALRAVAAIGPARQEGLTP